MDVPPEALAQEQLLATEQPPSAGAGGRHDSKDGEHDVGHDVSVVKASNGRSETTGDSAANGTDVKMAATTKSTKSKTSSPNNSQAGKLHTQSQAGGAITSSPPASSPPTASQAPGEPDLNAVREILFGAMVTEHNQRFERIEEHVESQVQYLRETFDTQLSQLRSQLSDQIDQRFNSLQTKLDANAANTLKQHNQLESQLNDATGTLTSELEANISETKSAFESAIAALSSSVSTRIDGVDQRVEETRDTGHEVTQQLSEDKLDRSALATMFASLSQQIDMLAPPTPRASADNKTAN